MAEQLFWYKGRNTDNQRVEGLTWEQVSMLKKEEEELLKAEALDARLGPAINKEIGSYVKQNPATDPRGAMASIPSTSNTQANQSIPQPQPSAVDFSLGSEGMSRSLDTLMQRSNPETLGSLSSGSDQQQESPNPINVDTQTAYNGLLKGVPEDIAKDLIWQYHNGVIKPREFLKEVSAAKKAINDINLEDQKADRVSQRKIREQGMASQGDVDKQYVVNEGNANTQVLENTGYLDKQKMSDDAALQRLREENASRERIAGMEKNKAMTRDDKVLSQIDKTLRNDYIVKQRAGQLQYAQNTLDLLNSENPVANQAAKTQIARLSGEVGVLTDKDVERFGGSKALVTRLDQSIQEAMSGKLSKRNKFFLTDVAKTFYSSSVNSLNDRLTELATGQSEAFEIPVDRIAPLVNAYGVNHPGIALKNSTNQPSTVLNNGNAKTIPPPQQNTGSIPTIKGDDDYNKLPSGTVFIAPNGKKMRKP